MRFEERIHRVISRETENIEPEAAHFLKTIQEKSKLCIWGLGSYGHNWYSYLRSLGIHADYVYNVSPEALDEWHGREKRLTFPSTEELCAAYLADMTVLVTMRNAQPLVDALHAEGVQDIYAPTVNFFSFDTSLRYVGKPEKLGEMEREVCSLRCIA
jgi:hypothetical protein